MSKLTVSMPTFPALIYGMRHATPVSTRVHIPWWRIHPRALELHGYEKARRSGMMAMVGGKDKTRIREATPPAFRDVLLSMARSAHP